MLTLKFALKIIRLCKKMFCKFCRRPPMAPPPAGLAATSCGVAVQRADFACLPKAGEAKSGLKILAQNKSFRYLWLGQLVSSLGDRLTQMGILAFLMLSANDKGDKVAMITFFNLLPFLLFGPLFGALVDKYSRKNIMIIADIARAAMVLLIPAIWVNTHSLFIIMIWFFILGMFSALFTPAKMSIIANITEKEALLEANSMIVTTGMVATLIGTLIAGAVIKIIGIKTSFHINALTYVISAIFILKIVYQRSSKSCRIRNGVYTDFLNDIKEGMNYVNRHKIILQLILLSSIFSFMSSFAYILILNYGAVVLNQGPFGIGCLLSSAGFGMIIGSVFLLKQKKKLNYAKAIYSAYAVMGIFCLLLYLRPDFPLTLLILFFAGIGAAVITITLDTVFQRVTTDDLKGKIFAARGVVTNCVFLVSLLLIGVLVKYMQATALFAVIGAAGILTALGVILYEKRWGYALMRAIMVTVMKFYFGFKVSGKENLPKSRRVIFAGNHTSLIDGIALGCAYPRRIYFLVAEEIFKTKPWGWVLKRLGFISVKRGGFNKEAIREALSYLKLGYAIGIFPEGKISKDGKLDAGKAGMAIIARLANADIIPFAIEGAHEAWPLENKYPRRFPISVCFGTPVDIKEYSVPEELVNEVMQDISELKHYLEREGYLKVDPDEIVKHLINIG